MTPRPTPLRMRQLPFALLVMLAAPPLTAQSLPPTAPAVETGASGEAPVDARTLDALVVTAQRRATVPGFDRNRLSQDAVPSLQGVELAVGL